MIKKLLLLLTILLLLSNCVYADVISPSDGVKYGPTFIETLSINVFGRVNLFEIILFESIILGTICFLIIKKLKDKNIKVRVIVAVGFIILMLLVAFLGISFTKKRNSFTLFSHGISRVSMHNRRVFGFDGMNRSASSVRSLIEIVKNYNDDKYEVSQFGVINIELKNQSGKVFFDEIEGLIKDSKYYSIVFKEYYSEDVFLGSIKTIEIIEQEGYGKMDVDAYNAKYFPSDPTKRERLLGEEVNKLIDEIKQHNENVEEVENFGTIYIEYVNKFGDTYSKFNEDIIKNWKYYSIRIKNYYDESLDGDFSGTIKTIEVVEM